MAAPHLTANHEHSRMFQPPPPVGSAPAQPDYFSTTSRKRSRADSSQEKSMIREWQSPAWAHAVASPIDDHSSGSFSTESLLVNEKYKLRGGFDTPGLFASADLDVQHINDIAARRTMQDPMPRFQLSEPAFGPLARERNGYARQVDFSTQSPSWTRLAITLPFSIAGKMFTFGTSVLKGFYAGGGQGYELGHDAARKRDWTSDQLTPVPGSWYESPSSKEFEGDFEQDNTPVAARPPPNKRRLTDKDSWVMVGTPDLEASTPPSPRRRISQSSPRARPVASRTTSRRSHMASRRQSYNTQTTPATQTAHLRLSMPVRPTSPTEQSSNTYPSPDAERYVRRQAKQERATDRTMTSMSQRLEELIKQGQAALGTKFTVEGNDFDEYDEY